MAFKVTIEPLPEDELLAWPDAPRGREINALEITDYVGLMGELENGDREIPSEPCSGVLISTQIIFNKILQPTLQCLTCNQTMAPTEVKARSYVAGRACPNVLPRQERLGGPMTMWPGTTQLSRFARWNMACPKLRGKVALVGRCGGHDLSAYRVCRSLTEIDPLELSKLEPEVWKKICKEKRRQGAVDLVIVYMPPPKGTIAMLKDLIHGRGAIRSIVHAGAISGMKAREVEVLEDGAETPEWTFYEYSRR